MNEWLLSERLCTGQLIARLLVESVEYEPENVEIGDWFHKGGIVIAKPGTNQHYYWSDTVLEREQVR